MNKTPTAAYVNVGVVRRCPEALEELLTHRVWVVAHDAFSRHETAFDQAPRKSFGHLAASKKANALIQYSCCGRHGVWGDCGEPKS